jgi:Flp pilus assembly protein TadD
LERARIGRTARPTPFEGRYGYWEMAIALTAVAVFVPTVGFGWVYDDQLEIVLNPLIRSLSNLPTIFRTTVWAGSGMETYLYRPLALVTYSLNHTLSGLAPWSYHLVNVLLHAGASVMVFRVGRLWGLPALAAGLGGIIFAVHPAHVEVVAAVFGRKDLLAGFFILAMVLLHGPAVTRGGWRMPLPVLAYAAAMLSKEVGVVGVAFVAIQDWFLSPDRSRLARDGRRAGLYVAYVAALLVYVLVRNRVTGGVGVPETYYFDNPLVAAPIASRLATAVVVIGKGLALQLLPLTLSPDYSFDAIPAVRTPLDWRFLATLALMAAIGWSLLRSRTIVATAGPTGKRGTEGKESVRAFPDYPLLFIAVLWYVISLLPAANILVTVGTIFGERLLYLPSVAFSLMVGGGAAWLIRGGLSPTRTGTGARSLPHWVRPLAMAGTALWTGALVFQTIVYSSAWKDDISLFRYAVASVPNSTKAHHKLGEELLRAGEIGPALPHLRRALEIAPDNEFAAQTLGVARQRIARLYLPSEPGGSPPSPPPADAEILYLLGQLSRERGDPAGAEAYWAAALASDSTHAPSQADLGTLQLLRGDTASALPHLRVAVRLDPTMARAWLSLGQLHLERGEVREAREALEAFVRLAGTRFPDQVAWAREALAGLPPT